MEKLILIAIAGAAGTVSRYELAGLVQRLYGGTFPFGTAFVNVTGSFLFGFIWALAEERLVISGETRAIILTGFMGAFTTFSTFMFETSGLMRDTQWIAGFANLALQIILGLACMVLGMAAGRLI